MHLVVTTKDCRRDLAVGGGDFPPSSLGFTIRRHRWNPSIDLLNVISHVIFGFFKTLWCLHCSQFGSTSILPAI